MAQRTLASFAFPARFFEILLASSLAVIPLACMTGETKDGDAPLIQGRMKILSIDRNAKIIRFESQAWDCETNPPTSTFDTAKAYYEITGGKLWIWDDGVCEAIGYSGTGTDIVGHWQSLGPILTKPAPNAPASCANTPSQLPFTYIQDQAIDITLSETEMISNTSGTLCSAEMQMYDLLGYDADTATTKEFKITSKKCTEATATRLSDNKVATFTSQYANGTATTTVQFNGKTCSLTKSRNFDPNAEHCQADSTDGVASQKFYQCATEAGLFVTPWDGTIEKRGALSPLGKAGLIPK